MLCGIAINKFGLSPKEFYSLTPRQFNYALKDYERQLELQRELFFKSSSVEVINKYRSSSEFLPFSWEKAKKPYIPTEEDWAKWDRKN